MTKRYRTQLARDIINRLDAAQLVTWERREDGARVLAITNIWPYEERPAYGPFICGVVDGLASLGVTSDVLYIRGYRSPLAYLAGALTSLLLPIAYPKRYLLVHVHGGETALAARFFLGRPVLVSYLGTDLLGTQVGGPLRLRIKCWLRSLVLRRHAAMMSASTTKSAEMEELLTARARKRNTVIPDGVDRERFRPDDQAHARAALGWPSERSIVLFAGRATSPEKQLWLAQQAIELAQMRMPNIELRVADGLPPDQMPLHYVASDCLLHTSSSEGSPNVVKEALACDLPVIATPSGDVRELLDGVSLSEVCEPAPAALADALLRMLQLGQRSNGRAMSKHLSIEATTRRTLDCYRALGFPVSTVGDHDSFDATEQGTTTTAAPFASAAR